MHLQRPHSSFAHYGNGLKGRASTGRPLLRLANWPDTSAADKRYSDMADFRENKEGAGDWLASIQSVAAEFGPPHSGDWGLVYAFLSEFVHPNLV